MFASSRHHERKFAQKGFFLNKNGEWVGWTIEHIKNAIMRDEANRRLSETLEGGRHFQREKKLEW